MEIKLLLDKIPYLYHLTSNKNLQIIKAEGFIYSSTELFKFCNLSIDDLRLRTRRKEHISINNNGVSYHIRDQRPLNKALGKCLTDGCTVEEYIFLLNNRVFLWPNLKRLKIHYTRYIDEKPVILKLKSVDVYNINKDRIEITNINSGATRPSGSLGGKAASRGLETFQKIENYQLKWNSIAEVTVLNYCKLPDEFSSYNSFDELLNES